MGLRRFLATLGAPVAAAGPAAEVARGEAPLQIDATPDRPVAFGYRVQWFAVKAADPRAVSAALGVGTAAAANWRSGLGVASDAAGVGWVFITPAVDGWVFIVGHALGSPDHRAVLTAPQQRDAHVFERRFAGLYGRFTDVQFFAGHRVTDYVAWARARNGRVLRMFAAGDGRVFANSGQQTAEESALKLPDLSGLSLPAAERALASSRARAPDENTVLALARAWSADPSQLGQRRQTPAAGLLARLT